MRWPLDPTAWLLAEGAVWLLAAARAFGLAWTAPGWATPALGPRLRIGLAAALALIVGPMLAPQQRALGLALPADPAAPAAGLAWLRLAGGLLVEGVIGAGLGLTAGLVVSGARQAGELIGIQAGLTPAAVFDPETLADGATLTPLGHLFGLLALAVFLTLDGPLTVVDALVESYQVVPVAAGVLGREAESTRDAGTPDEPTAGRPLAAVRWLAGRLDRALELAVRLAAPVALALILTGLALALVSRTAPASPLANLAWPVRSTLGLALVALSLIALVATLGSVWAGWAQGLSGSR